MKIPYSRKKTVIMSDSLKTTILLVSIVFQFCVAMDCSVALVGINDKFYNSSIGVVHHLMIQPLTSLSFVPLRDIVLLRRTTL